MLKNASFLSCLAFFKTGWSSFLTSSTSLGKSSATPNLAPFLRLLMWALMNSLSWKKHTFAIIGLGFDLCSVFALVGIRWTLSNSILLTSCWEIFISFVKKHLSVSSASLGDSSWLSFMPKNFILLRRVKHSCFIWRLSSSLTEDSFFFASFNSADIDLTVPCSSFTSFCVNCKLSSSCAIFSFCRSNSGSYKSTLSNFSSICSNLLPHSEQPWWLLSSVTTSSSVCELELRCLDLFRRLLSKGDKRDSSALILAI